jgi:hypothetical protein
VRRESPILVRRNETAKIKSPMLSRTQCKYIYNITMDLNIKKITGEYLMVMEINQVLMELGYL